MTEPEIRIPRAFNVASRFVDRNLSGENAGRTALRHQGRTLTYSQLAELVNRSGNLFRSLGVEAENRVALLLEDSPEFIASFWGAVKIGAVPVPLNTLLRPPDYEFCLSDSRAKVLVAHAKLWDGVAAARDLLPDLKHVLITGGAVTRTEELERSLKAASTALDPAPTCSDDVAFWLYSSGSTGVPKAAVHLHHDMVFCAELYAQRILNLTREDVVFSAAKLFFAYGLGNSMYFPAHVGASSVLFSSRPTPEAVFEVISRERPTVFFGVPTLFAGMLAVPDAERKYDLSSLRLCVSAGEPLPEPLYRRWQERFRTEILDGIGTTEVLHIFISNRPGQVRPGSSGTVVPGYEVRIVDENGADAKAGEIGNLLVKGESTCAYYWNQHQKTKETIQGDWIATGDKYYRDEEGYFWYCGRSDDMLKVGGIWVSPTEVESALVSHQAVLEAAVVGMEDEQGLVKPRAFVVLKTDFAPGKEMEEELKAFVKQRLAPYKYPRWITFVSELPKTATGKIQRFRLREPAAVAGDGPTSGQAR